MPDLTPPAPKKRKSPRAAVGKTAAQTLTRRAKAVEMLLDNKSCQQVGDALGMTRQGAYLHAKKALDELKAQTLDSSEAWRDYLTLEHLDQLRLGKQLRDGDGDSPGAVEGFNVVDKALSQLKTLWVAPQTTSVKAEITGANGGPLQMQAVPADLSKLSDVQLAQLEQLLLSISPAPEEPLEGI